MITLKGKFYFDISKDKQNDNKYYGAFVHPKRVQVGISFIQGLNDIYAWKKMKKLIILIMVYILNLLVKMKYSSINTI